MRLLNTKTKHKYLLLVFLLKSLFTLTPFIAFSCENLKFKKSFIWIESKLKIKKKFLVELANTNIKRQQGLQCRKYMQSGKGMLFVWKRKNYRVFWMNNTYIPLDIIFFDENKLIFDFHLDAMPLNKIPIMSNGKAKYVLEINAGEFKKLGLKLGQKLIIDK